MSTKKLRSYRLSEEAYLAIKRMAGEDGTSEAAVIEAWALTENGPEKKSGGAAEVLQDDEPDDLVVKVAKPLKLPAKEAKRFEEQKKAVLESVALPAGVKKGSELPEPKKKLFSGPVLDIQNGRIANQATNLGAGRGERKPIKRPGEK